MSGGRQRARGVSAASAGFRGKGGLTKEARGHLAETLSPDQLVGRSPAFTAALEEALAAAGRNTPALLEGEHGSGREVLAKVLHAGGPRAEAPFVAVHCAHLPADLMDAALFGSEEGGLRPGRLDEAGPGLLYLHEVNRLEGSTQDRLVALLQEGSFRRGRGKTPVETRARVIASTSRSAGGLMTQGRLNPDLYRLLGASVIRVPPLRERKEDIPELARYYLEQFRRSAAILAEDFSRDAAECLVRYPWPGNIRELRNVVERTLVLHGSGPLIHAQHLPPEFTYGEHADLDRSYSLSQAVNEFERDLVERALRQADGVQTRAAELLGTTRRVLKYRMEKLNISPS